MAIETVDKVFASELRRQISEAVAEDSSDAATAIYAVLDRHCLLAVTISPESRVKVDPGAAARELTPGEWRTCLVRVANHARITSPLRANSPQFYDASHERATDEQRWLEFEMIDRSPLAPTLAGTEVEYRAARLRSRTSGIRSAVIGMDVGQGTGDIGFRNDVVLTFVNRVEGQTDESPTEVRGTILDADDRRSIPARVTIRGNSGTWHLADSLGGVAAPYSRLKPNLPNSPEVHATLSAAPFVARLLPGDYTIRVERGKEYVPEIRKLTVGRQPLNLEFRLRRWIDMSDRGWYSGDTHVHRSVEELPNVMLAEDLNVAMPITYWAVESDRPPIAVQGHDPEKSSGLVEVDATHVIYSTNTEYEIFRVGAREQTLGALLILNHRQPLTLGAPPLAPVVAAARAQGALLDLDKHSWPWSLMLLPLVDVDLFELANNHVWQTEFGLKQWTLSTAPDYMNIEQDAGGFTESGWIDFGFRTYYALINCGFRMRVSAGTASGVHPVPLGFGRVYVYCPDGFNYDQWIAGLNAGRSFVSTGPMLDVRFNDMPPGAVFASSQGKAGRIHISGTAESSSPLERIEIVVNGRVARTIAPANRPTPAGGYRSPIDESIERRRSFWVAVRCFEKHPTGRVRFAHTNPSYADIEGMPLIPRRAEAEYFVRRIEEEIENNRQALSAAALGEFQRSLSVYQEIANRAK